MVSLVLVRVRLDVPAGSSSSKRRKRKRRKEKKEIHHRSKIRTFKTEKTSEVWGKKFDLKAISKRKVHGLPDL